MSFIAFELDALNHAPFVARAAGVDEEAVIAGLVRMWAWCFREKQEHVTATHVKGFFGVDCTEALSSFGFTEADDGKLRVKGARRYLRVAEARSKGGKAAAGNLRRGSQKQPTDSRSSPPATPRLEPEASRESAPASSRPLHRAPNTEHLTSSSKTLAPAPPATSAEGFFAWAQEHRAEVTKRPRERPPKAGLGAWFSFAMGEVNGDEERLRVAWAAFCLDQHWAAKGTPWAAWVAQWERYVRPPAPPPPVVKTCAICPERAVGNSWGVELCPSHFGELQRDMPGGNALDDPKAWVHAWAAQHQPHPEQAGAA